MVADIVHGQRGLLISHCDGENGLLLPLYKASGIDILQSVNVQPMVSNTYPQTRAALRPDQVISGGIAAVMLVKSSVSNGEFDDYVNQLRCAYRKGDRLILEVSDNVTPDADIGRLRTLVDFARTL